MNCVTRRDGIYSKARYCQTHIHPYLCIESIYVDGSNFIVGQTTRVCHVCEAFARREQAERTRWRKLSSHRSPATMSGNRKRDRHPDSPSYAMARLGRPKLRRAVRTFSSIQPEICFESVCHTELHILFRSLHLATHVCPPGSVNLFTFSNIFSRHLVEPETFSRTNSSHFRFLPL